MSEGMGNDYYILFQVAGTTYGIKSDAVRQMEMVEHLTPVPNAPKSVEGVVILRNQAISVLNLRDRFGLEKVPYDLRTRLIVVQFGSRMVGLIVDSAREFVSIPKDQISPPPEEISGKHGTFIEGIANIKGRVVLIVNVDGIINPFEPSTLQPKEFETNSIQVQETR